jgi:spore maturation protein CgeB
MLTNCVKYEILSNRGLQGVKEKYKYFISHPQEAMDIGNKARAEILHGHTLKHRIQTIIDKLSSCKKRKAQPAKAPE